MTNTLTLIITAYCACQICCGPHADGITASGRPPVEGRTAAFNGLPFGTPIWIPGVGHRVIEDRMASRWGNTRLDIYFRSHRDAQQFGIRTNTITILPRP